MKITRLIMPLAMSAFVLLASCSKKEDTSPTLANATATSATPTTMVASSSSTYQFSAPAGTDVTVALQQALNKYKVVQINNSYIISNSLTIPSGVTLTAGGQNNAILKAANTCSGLLASRGIYINLSNQNSVNIWGIQFQPADNMVDESTYANTVILLSNSSGCNIYGNNFSFSFAYNKGMAAVWITGPSKNNTIANNYIKTLGITYCENGASNNIVQYNQLVNSSSNALGGIGNGTSPCQNNQVLNNTVQGAGRMGIEDQQNTVGTIISGNKISGTGQSSTSAAGERTGISAVAQNTVVENNIISNAKDYYIEVGGSNSIKVLNNTITDNGSTPGIFVNFLGSSVASASKLTLVSGNTITGCSESIEAFGGATTQYLTISSNNINDAVSHAIDINVGTSTYSSLSILKNNITFTKSTSTGRYAISTYTNVNSGQQHDALNIENNVFTYNGTAPKSTGKDVSMLIAIDDVVIGYNTINGYAGGLNSGVISNGAVTTGVSFIGNTVNLASWNTAQFPQ